MPNSGWYWECWAAHDEIMFGNGPEWLRVYNMDHATMLRGYEKLTSTSGCRLISACSACHDESKSNRKWSCLMGKVHFMYNQETHCLGEVQYECVAQTTHPHASVGNQDYPERAPNHSNVFVFCCGHFCLHHLWPRGNYCTMIDKHSQQSPITQRGIVRSMVADHIPTSIQEHVHIYV